MKSEKEARKRIFSLIKGIYKARAEKNRFLPARSMVNYGGRVYDEKEIISLVDASLDFWLTEGRFAAEFEDRLARFIGVKYCLLTNSGSSANLLAVSALTSAKLKDRRLKPGDEVITTACGFPTTLNPIIQNRLVPVFIDIELGTYNINCQNIEKAVTKKTKAVFVAHTLGNPADLHLLQEIAKRHKLWLIEDNCDALGSSYDSRLTGSFGDISTCSFYPPHHITMGEGGAVLTSDPLLRRIIISFRDWGRDCWCKPGQDNSCRNRFNRKFFKLPFGYDHKYVFSHIGYNLKVTDMQAAIGCAQMDKLPGFIRARRQNFEYFYESFRQYEKYFILPQTLHRARPSWFGFPLFVKKNQLFSRSDIVSYLEAKKISTRMLFGGNLLKQPAYEKIAYRVSPGGLKNTDLVMKNLFWIGVYPGLTHAMREYVLHCMGVFISLKEKSCKPLPK